MGEEIIELKNGVIEGWINMLHVDGEILIFTINGAWWLDLDDEDTPFKLINGTNFNMLNGVGNYGTGAMWAS